MTSILSILGAALSSLVTMFSIDHVADLVLGVGDHQEPLHWEGHGHEDRAGEGHLGQRQDDREDVGGDLNQHFVNWTCLKHDLSWSPALFSVVKRQWRWSQWWHCLTWAELSAAGWRRQITPACSGARSWPSRCCLDWKSVKLETSFKHTPVTPKKPTKGKAIPSSMNFHVSISGISVVWDINDQMYVDVCHILPEWYMERDWHFSPGPCNISVETLNRRRRAGDSHSEVSSCSVIIKERQFTELDIFFKFTRRLFCELIQDQCGRALKDKDSQDLLLHYMWEMLTTLFQ